MNHPVQSLVCLVIDYILLLMCMVPEKVDWDSLAYLSPYENDFSNATNFSC